MIPYYVVDEEIKKNRYHSTLKDENKEFISSSACRTLEDMIDRAHSRETELEICFKHMSDQVQVSEGSAKKLNTFDSRSRGQQGRCSYRKCRKTHDGEYRGEWFILL